MNIIKMMAWTFAYWALYLPASFVLKQRSDSGSWLGIVIVGLVFTAILLAYLTVRFREEPTEVPNHAKETEESTDPARSGAAYEVRTDVDLGRLDAADDDLSS